jgi:hypothetical protein
MMKKYFKILFSMMALASVLFISCQHEENEIEDANPENLTKSSELTGLLQRVANSTTDNDDAIDSTTCVSVKMPYSIYVHDQQGEAALEYERTISTPEEQAQAIALIGSLHSPEDHFTLVFPITVVFANGEEQVVQSQEILDGIKAQCEQPDPVDIYCFNLNYPINIFGYDSNFQLANTYSIANDFALFTLLFNLNPTEYYAIDYPISITKSDGETLVIHNNIELLGAIQTAITDCNPVVNPCPNPHILTDGLIIYMPFANEARDLISGENAIINDNYPPLFVADRSGNSNSAVSFGGTSSYDFLKIPESSTNQLRQGDSLTISLWFRMQNTNPGNLEYLFQKSEGASNNTVTLAVYDGNTPLFINEIGGGYNLWDTDWNMTAALHTDTTNWHHLALTIDGDTNTVKLYRDGILRNTDENSNLNISLEAFDYYLGRNFKGYLDDIRVYRKTLSAAEIQTLYNLEGDNNTCLN